MNPTYRSRRDELQLLCRAEPIRARARYLGPHTKASTVQKSTATRERLLDWLAHVRQKVYPVSLISGERTCTRWRRYLSILRGGVSGNSGVAHFQLDSTRNRSKTRQSSDGVPARPFVGGGDVCRSAGRSNNHCTKFDSINSDFGRHEDHNCWRSEGSTLALDKL